MRYILIKRSRLSSTPYAGPSCDLAGVPRGKYYLTEEAAQHDMKLLNKVNPVGFTVISIEETATPKFLVFDWASACGPKLTNTGFSHNEEYTGDIFEAAKTIFEAGLNVLIKHSEDRDILFVDTRRFQQR